MHPFQSHRGIGPVNYTRSDERIFEDVCETLTHDGELDARFLRVTVRGGCVILDGRVADRRSKYLAEDLAATIPGVREVENRLKTDRSASAFDPELEHGIYGRLIEEHRMVAAMLDIVTSTPREEAADRVNAWRMVSREILAHAHAEDRILYHELDGSYELDKAIDDARADHARVEQLIREIDTIADGGDAWMARVKTLKAELEAHVRFEEEVMLPHAHNVLDAQHSLRLLDLYEYERNLEMRRMLDAAAPQPADDIVMRPPRVTVATEAHKIK